MSAREMDLPADGRVAITKEERETRKVLRAVEAKQAMSDNATAKKAFADNYQRLRSERQSREAAAPPTVPGKAKPKRKKT
jgi:hypothetical protein